MKTYGKINKSTLSSDWANLLCIATHPIPQHTSATAQTVLGLPALCACTREGRGYGVMGLPFSCPAMCCFPGREALPLPALSPALRPQHTVPSLGNASREEWYVWAGPDRTKQTRSALRHKITKKMNHKKIEEMCFKTLGSGILKKSRNHFFVDSKTRGFVGQRG